MVFTAAEGNLTLVITGGKSDEVFVWERDEKIAMTVCSEKVDKALPGWRNRITRTTDPKIPGHLPIVELAEGTPAVFQHLIAAAHFSPTEDLPEFIIEDGLSIKEIYNIAMLSHQYGALRLIAGNVPGWLEDHDFDASGWKLDELDEFYDSQLEYMWIAYEFGVNKVFH